jgi:hypothetical protein
MRRGVQCQHCHMPDREHTWKGVHDPETVRQGVKIDVSTRPLRVTVTNVGAGHHLPTTPTPAAWLDVELVAGGTVVASASKRIGRHLLWERGWKEVEDTRIPPGEALVFAPRLQDAGADGVRVTLRMQPDEYYERFYRALLRRGLVPAARRMIERALDRATRSHYVVWQRTVPIARPSGR